VKSFLHSSNKVNENVRKTDLVTLLETAKNRLDDLEIKNKKLIEFSRKMRSN
jgi:hypothetical protein